MWEGYAGGDFWPPNMPKGAMSTDDLVMAAHARSNQRHGDADSCMGVDQVVARRTQGSMSALTGADGRTYMV